MTQQGKPGWYDDGTGTQRWWDGRGWTGHTRPAGAQAAEAVPDRPLAEVPPATTASEAKRAPRRVPLKATVATSVAALLLGLIIGGAAHSGSAESAEAGTAASSDATVSVSALQDELRTTTAERDRLKAAASAAGDQDAALQSRGTALDERAAHLARLSTKLDARSKRLDEREANAAVESGTSDTSSTDEQTDAAPGGATAQCSDGTYSFSAHRSGTCSHHGGVATWL